MLNKENGYNNATDKKHSELKLEMTFLYRGSNKRGIIREARDEIGPERLNKAFSLLGLK